MKKVIALLAVAGCGDNITKDMPDAGPRPDVLPDASPFVAPTPVAVPISTAGVDQLLGVVPSGMGFYAVGFRAPSFENTSDREMVLVKLNGMGNLDNQFGGGDGIVTLNGQVGANGESWRGIVVQPGGKIVVSGVVEDETVATDRDVMIARFNTDGTLDTTFGTNSGTTRLDLNTALAGTMGLDATWGLGVDGAGKLYVHGGQRTATLDGGGGDTLTDTDYVVVRLTVDGQVDTGYATNGKFTLDIQRSSANVRDIDVLADGSIIANGYASSASTGNTVQPVVYKLTPAGVLDTNFASGGLFHEVVLATQTEVYGIAIQSDGKLVTAGYGRNDSGAANDWISLRLTATGALDTTWADQGKYLLDPTGMAIADNCRNAIALPNGRTALIGSGGPTNATSDAYAVILDNTGKPDTAFGNGILKFELGQNDALFGGAVATNGNRVMFAGFKGGGATPSATSNDDSYVISLGLGQ